MRMREEEAYPVLPDRGRGHEAFSSQRNGGLASDETPMALCSRGLEKTKARPLTYIVPMSVFVGGLRSRGLPSEYLPLSVLWSVCLSVSLSLCLSVSVCLSAMTRFPCDVPVSRVYTS